MDHRRLVPSLSGPLCGSSRSIGTAPRGFLHLGVLLCLRGKWGLFQRTGPVPLSLRPPHQQTQPPRVILGAFFIPPRQFDTCQVSPWHFTVTITSPVWADADPYAPKTVSIGVSTMNSSTGLLQTRQCGCVIMFAWLRNVPTSFRRRTVWEPRLYR